MAETTKAPLYGEYFYKFFQCPHWIWYDIYGDAEHKRHIPPLLDLIYKGKPLAPDRDLGRHKEFEQVKPELMRDLDEAFLATVELMKQGKNIYHGVLMSEDWVGMPDLLEARPGKSWLGDHYYVVYDVQSSLDLRDEYKFQLIFYSLILERIQGVRPREAYVIDPEGNERSFLIEDFIDHFHLTRLQIEKILNGEKPAPFLKAGCKRTPWYSLCISETEGCSDVSLVYRMSQADQRRLYDIGIKTVDNLAAADVNMLRERLEDWPFDKVLRFSNQAKVLVGNKPMITRKPNFPNVRYDVYFDIESDPLRDIDYLLGFCIKDNQTGTTEYKYFLAKDKEHEPEIWARFLDYLAGLEDFVIYHYAFYERQVFDRLALRYGAPGALVDKFKENTIDLHMKLVDSVVLPIYFYSLKDVGAYLGYTWADPHAGGAESVVWYNEYVEKKDEAVLQKILRYNEDDVRATMLIKEWLAQQKPSKSRETLDE
ncbi:MAG TPA: TM0106 family RecB-like putative nuclease [Candidatus Paceibacterota bacterium]|nr:TM0106 family RecB-like putative nuclease [Candidatus Paceibacterota bacterium]